MFNYTDNKQVKKEFREIVKREGETMTNVANKLDITAQQFNNRFNNNRLALSDLKNWLNVLGYDLVVDFVKRE